MKKLIIIFISVLLLSSGTAQTIKQNTSKREFIIIGIEAPRNFRVDLKDVRNRKVYRNVFVAKRCDNWVAFRVGDKIKLKIATAKIRGEEFYEFTDIQKIMCK